MTTILMYGTVTRDMIVWLADNPEGITVDIGKTEPITFNSARGQTYQLKGPIKPSFIRFTNDATALMFRLKFNENLIGEQYDYETIHNLG
jgi:hypothetical protein